MSKKLDELMARASHDTRWEDAAFVELLKSNVYAHIPLSDRLDGGRIRFVQFHRPEDGQLVLPFFSDKQKAQLATGSSVKIVMFKGRQFMEMTRGATLMLNPNDQRCVLFPEEVDVLLNNGQLARIETLTVPENSGLKVGPITEEAPAWLMEALTMTLSKLRYVVVAYMAAVYVESTPPTQQSFLAGISIKNGLDERATHAVASVIQPLCRLHGGPVLDLATYDCDGPAPEWVADLSLIPFYDAR